MRLLKTSVFEQPRILDLETSCVYVNLRKKEKARYATRLYSLSEGDHKVPVSTLPGLEIDLDAIFDALE